MEAEVTQRGIIDCQVCVSKDWTDNEIIIFAEQENNCGTTSGWSIRRAGDSKLCGCAERTPCADRCGFVHVMLDA
tara:strand:+ start:258 stop:482 length:225 start_codon:yes stop_codon:yes gene_type:complete